MPETTDVTLEMHPAQVNPSDDYIELPQPLTTDNPTYYQAADNLMTIAAQIRRRLSLMRREIIKSDGEIAKLQADAELLMVTAAKLAAQSDLKRVELDLLRTQLRVVEIQLENSDKELT